MTTTAVTATATTRGAIGRATTTNRTGTRRVGAAIHHARPDARLALDARARAPRTTTTDASRRARGEATRARAATNGDDMDAIWAQAHPKYLQSDEDACGDAASTRRDDAGGASSSSSMMMPVDVAGDVSRRRTTTTGVATEGGDDSVWDAIRREASVDAADEPMLSSYLYASILSHETLEQSLSFVLANKLADSTLLPTQLMEIFNTVLLDDETEAGRCIREAVRADVSAFKERDPACVGYAHALLNFKGFHALEAHRIQHALWNRGQKLMALALQSRISAVFSLDIHPAARLGKGILIDHGTGVVIGETCVIGDSVSILQGVTLGGTGKATGDRHPKVESHVLIGAHSTVLGNIKIERGSMISAGSLVLKPVKARTIVAGSPAKVVGQVCASEPELVMDHRIAASAPAFGDDAETTSRRRASQEEGERKNKSDGHDVDIERVRSQVLSADEKRRRRRDRG